MGTIRFEIRKEKTDQQGKAPIRLIYQLHGDRRYYNTGLKLLAPCWDAKQQRAIYLDKKAARKIAPGVDYDRFLSDGETLQLNSRLNELSRKIGQIEQRFELDQKQYSAEAVIDRLNTTEKGLTSKQQPSSLLFDFIDQYITRNEATRQKGSLSVYRALKSHLAAYQDHTRRKVTFDRIDYSFFEAFQAFLITKRNLNNTTVAKQLSTLKTFLNYASVAKVAVIDKSRYSDFKIKKPKLEVIALTSEEFNRLYNLKLPNQIRLERVRDVFCFSCVTGFRYSDLKQLRREHIKKDEITLTVKKTAEILKVPLNKYSRAILAKYADMPTPLPVGANAQMNKSLKELCELAGIDDPVEIVRYKGSKREAEVYPKYELISVHVGRKTFVTLSLERGMSAEEVMACTGHSDYKSFKRYVNVTEQRKKAVMAHAWDGTGKLKAV